MKKSLWSALLLLILFSAAYWLIVPEELPPLPEPKGAFKAPRPKPAPASPALITSPAQVEVALATTKGALPPSPRIEAPPPPPVKIPPDYRDTVKAGADLQEVEEIALNVRSFGQRFGGNPTGSNAEIAKVLSGGNEAGATYLPANRRLNENGELIDRWGTPYFFHANSATEMEIRSAGPDKKLYTQDDIVTK